MSQIFNHQYLSFGDTGKFSKIATDYQKNAPQLSDFYQYLPGKEGIRKAIQEREKYPVNRKLLADELEKQYAAFPEATSVRENIDLLRNENTFTVCTAHQPNILTGHLYFIYKILHTIKLAADCRTAFPDYHFVPVFFMGSEDADLDELNHFTLEGKLYQWETRQKGAVGRMKGDKALQQLLAELKGRLTIEPFGAEITSLMEECYAINVPIEQATFRFVHHLFARYGLIVLLPDNADFKRETLSIFEDDLFNHSAEKIVTNTSSQLAQHYKAQAYAREINLFYMKDDIRNRIVRTENRFVVHNTEISFTKEELEKELANHPECFSPNVILRGIFQERILPGVAFVGGGGELAYWLQLKSLFQHYQTPYPVLFLRNSFLIEEKKWKEQLEKLKINLEDLFQNEDTLFQKIIEMQSETRLSLREERSAIHSIFQQIETAATEADPTLKDHVRAIFTKNEKHLAALEKKMLAAEKKKYEAARRQLHKVHEALFPDNGLQERTENFLLFYSKWGKEFFDALYQASPSFHPAFVLMEEK